MGPRALHALLLRHWENGKGEDPGISQRGRARVSGDRKLPSGVKRPIKGGGQKRKHNMLNWRAILHVLVWRKFGWFNGSRISHIHTFRKTILKMQFGGLNSPHYNFPFRYATVALQALGGRTRNFCQRGEVPHFLSFLPLFYFHPFLISFHLPAALKSAPLILSFCLFVPFPSPSQFSSPLFLHFPPALPLHMQLENIIYCPQSGAGNSPQASIP